MPIPATDRLAPHFTASELGADDPQAIAGIVSNLRRTAAYLEMVRGILGVPLRVTSGFRPPEYNATVKGASATSDHMTGLAADVVPIGMSLRQAYDRLQEAAATNVLPPWDQLIYYPVEGHLHIGLGTRLRKETRIKLWEGKGGTPILTASLVERLPDAASSVIASVNDGAAALASSTGLTLPFLAALSALILLLIVLA